MMLMLRQLRETDRLLLSLLAVAFVLRCAVVVIRWDNLSTDRDAYLAIAENLAAGNGYCSVAGQPTAFRPPLYPLLLAGCLLLGGTIAIAGVQVGLSTATVGLTWRLVRNAGGSRQGAALAGVLTACDPLLLEMTSQAMTETLFAFLTTALLCSLTRSNGLAIDRPVLSGSLIGLAALCRPSIWAFAGLWFLYGAWRLCCWRSPSVWRDRVRQWRRGLVLASVAAGVVSPWVVRNWMVFGKPIVMTTHGGYTLALGNNERFAADVVFGAESVWSEAGLRRWNQESEQRLAAAGIDRVDEVARDAALSRQTVQWIKDNPQRFAAACWLRLKRFWAVRPLRQDAGGQAVSFAVGAWYAVVFVMAVCGLFRHRRCIAPWIPSLLLVICLTVLHSIYWSNMRMRTPLGPVISLLAASAVFVQRETHQGIEIS